MEQINKLLKFECVNKNFMRVQGIKNNIYFGIISVLGLVSCSTGSVVTTNLHDITTFEPNSELFALPQTRLITKVSVQKNTFVPGPYQKYAKEFLGIEGAGSKPETSWKILDIKLSTLTEPDPEQYYSVKIINNPRAIETIRQMTDNEMILRPAFENSYQLYHNDLLSNVDELPYTDLSIKPFYFEDRKKKQKNVLADSAFALMPVSEKQVQAKSDKEKAYEAAKFIFKIRKRRFKLTSGQYDTFPEGIALSVALGALNKLEKDYLSLFIGKNYTDTISGIFSAVPAPGETLQRFVLFRFSGESGFNTSTQNEGVPIVMEVKDSNQNDILNQLQLPHLNSLNENMLFYRIPDKCSVSIYYDSHVLLESELPVFQAGAIVPLYISANKKKK